MRAVGQNSYARHPLLARMLRDFRQIFAQERLAARNHQARDTQAGKDVNRVAQIIKTRVDSSVAIAVGRVAPNTREVAGIRHMEIGGREVVAPTRFSLFRKPMTSKMSHELLASSGNLIHGDFTLQHSVAQLSPFRREAHKGAGSRVADYGNAPHIKANDVGGKSHNHLPCHRILRS